MKKKNMMIIKNIRIFDGAPISGAKDIYIEDGIITAIKESTGEYDQGHIIVDGKGMLAVAGMTDSHKHVWQAPFKGYSADQLLLEYLDKVCGDMAQKISAEQLYQLNLYGYLQAAASGVSNVFDWSHIMNSEAHADAAVQAAIDSGMNVLFFHSTSAFGRDKLWNNSTIPHQPYVEQLVRSHQDQSNVRIGMGIRGPEFATMEVNRADIELAASLDCPVSMHLGSSILGKIHQPVRQLAEHGLLSERLNLVHCSTLSPEEYGMIAEAGCLVSITPEAEMQTALGYPAVALLADHPSAKWAIGTDIPTGATDSLIFQQRLLLQYYRGYKNQRLIDQMQFPTDMPYKANEFFFDSMAHANSYSGFNVSAKIEVGKNACINLFQWDQLEMGGFGQHPAFYFLQEEQLRTIVVNGKLFKLDGDWINHDFQALSHQVQEIAKGILS
ncbi:amidohydrolase family protein [Nubsella zeaxanthinifaciens]|uniref:amidohydrolase family protein n=1 Tax=Nubsella zeaxanthinifaciens TaxID=392412 RepID=UPI003D065586